MGRGEVYSELIDIIGSFIFLFFDIFKMVYLIKIISQALLEIIFCKKFSSQTFAKSFLCDHSHTHLCSEDNR